MAGRSSCLKQVGVLRHTAGPHWTLALVTALGVIVAALGVIAVPTPATAAAIPAPNLSWGPCAGPDQKGSDQKRLQCTTTRVPLDYDRLRGRTIRLALIRHRAGDPDRRIGTLFLNPGGPGQAGTTSLPGILGILSPGMLARFDIVSWDPRGVGESTAIRCFRSAAAETRFLDGRTFDSFPVGSVEMGEWIKSYRSLGRRCERRNGRLLRHVSTTDTARDLNVLRRAVRDRRLTYIGLSYGTFLGATYANLFPERVRAMVLDGNLDPTAYVNPRIRANGGRFLPTDLRGHADQGAEKTLNAFLRLCGAAAPADCAFSAGTPAATRAKYAALLQRLRSSPPDAAMTYAEAVATTSGALFGTVLWPDLATTLQELWATGDAGPPIAKRLMAARPAVGERITPVAAIRCSESPNPSAAGFRSANGFAVRRSGPVGAWWTWLSIACANWPATAADRYTGPWDRRTANPVLVAGTTHDPSTPYRGSKAMARLLDRARLLTVDGYGHTALGNSSSCATRHMSRYLVTKTLPPKGTRCEPDEVPFESGP